jgi:transitional endoplasmic reticulum ATPase
MSDELSDLFDACEAKPDSVVLHRVLIGALEDAGADGPPLLSKLEVANRPPAVRSLIGQFLLNKGQAADALPWFEGDAPAQLMNQVRCLVALEQGGKAAILYARATDADPSLVDAELEKTFKVKQLNSTTADVIDLAGRRTGNIKLVAGAVSEASPPLRFTDIGGLSEVKEQIRRRIILPFQKKSIFEKFKRKAGGGILFYGPPGCGKTLLAKATAGECNATFFPVRIPDVLDLYIGESEKHLAGIFEKARQNTPAVIFFDEIEALAAKRRFDTNSTQSSLVSTFLSEMDGFGTNNQDILVLAATNVPWAIDSAFRRPGRFDRVMFIPPPDVEARAEILKILMSDRPLANGVNLRMIADLLPGFSGADLRAVTDEATDIAIDESLDGNSDTITPISLAHLKQAAKSRKATTIEWLTSARNYAKYNNEGGLYDDVVTFLEKHTKS